MNLENLKNALNILENEVSPKLIGTKELTLLSDSINNLQNLIRRLENPEKVKRRERMFQ